MKGVTTRKNQNLKIWLNELKNRKQADLQLGVFEKKQISPKREEIILPNIFVGIENSKIFPMICFQQSI